MPEDVCLTRQNCRICHGNDLRPVIDLGGQYIASIFVNSEPPLVLKKRYPLEVVRCSAADGCGLVQLRHSISPEVLYADYGYRSDTNELMRANLLEITRQIEDIIQFRRGDLVLDIGCNDGTLLESYEAEGIERVGIDPAANVIQFAREKGIQVINDYFSAEVFQRAYPGRKARVITSIAMFYDLENPMKFVSDINSLLADDSVWVMELSYLPFMLAKNSFDTICHEHLEYYALRQIEWMLAREHMAVHRIEFNDMNGGSFRLFMRKASLGRAPEATRNMLEKTRNEEVALGLDSDLPYFRFRESALRVRTALGNLLNDLRSRGKTVYIYGASTKGNVILQYCGIDHRLVAGAADRNPRKWGKLTLGTDIPIISEEEARNRRPDYFLVLPWHFLESFKKREEPFLKRGGEFILPLPEVHVVGSEDR